MSLSQYVVGPLLSAFLIVVGVLFPVAFLIRLCGEGKVSLFWRWLKGSSSSAIIEISCGPFRRRSAIYGQAVKSWKISKVSLGCNSQGGFGAEWVDLIDCSSLPVERALNLVNKYSSFQDLMVENARQSYRIAELERKFADSERQLKNKSAGIKAVLRLIKQDKNLYRSKTSGWIRQWLYNLDHSDLNEVLPSAEEIKDWEGRFRIMTS